MAKLLLDECVPLGLMHHLSDFEVYSTVYMGLGKGEEW
jgi:hypothetical protein